MNAEIKAQWIAALRGDGYQQARSYLRTPDGYCCLGVLCELAVKAEVIPAPVFNEGYGFNSRYEYGTEKDEILLPEEVRVWAGLGSANPMVDPGKLPKGVGWDSDPDGTGGDPSLANMNDGGTSFEVIASVIEAQL
jgi:hypothetical protein